MRRHTNRGTKAANMRRQALATKGLGYVDCLPIGNPDEFLRLERGHKRPERKITLPQVSILQKP